MGALTCRWLPLLAVMVVSMAAVAATGFETDYTKLRTRRDVMALGSLISSVTGKNIFTVYTSYNGYGCYCGIGGKGTPVDEVDRCCQKHDRCFTVAQQGVCSSSKRSVYSNYYKYSIQKRDNTNDGVHADVHCAPISKYKDVAEGMCGKAICDCDRDVATCFAKHSHNRKYNRYDRRKCH